MHGSTKHATVAVATTISCVILFSVPMVLRYQVFSESYVSLTTGDLAPISQRISSVWCSAQVLKTQGNRSFEAFFLPEEPKLLDSVRISENFASYSELKVSGIEYWGFYLPAGSRINISTCARFPGATLTVVRGQKYLTDCLDAFRNREDQDLSEESEESEGDDHDAPSSSISSSEGVLTQEATEEGAFHCPHLSTYHATLDSEFSCSKDLIDKGRNLRYLESILLELQDTDYYYVIFSAGDILDIMLKNEVHWKFDLVRTTFDLRSSETNCSSDQETDQECKMSLKFASSQTCLVKMSDTTNVTHVPFTDIFVSSCEPRKGLYFIFFLLIFLAIGFCAFQ